MTNVILEIQIFYYLFIVFIIHSVRRFIIYSQFLHNIHLIKLTSRSTRSISFVTEPGGRICTPEVVPEEEGLEKDEASDVAEFGCGAAAVTK
jgi:hypothetical protein